MKKELKTMAKILKNAVLILLLGVGISALAQEGQTPPSGAKQDMHDAGSDMKSAGRDTDRAVHHAARATVKGTKKAYRATKRGTKKAYRSTKRETKKVVHKSAGKPGDAADKDRVRTQ